MVHTYVHVVHAVYVYTHTAVHYGISQSPVHTVQYTALGTNDVTA